MDVRRAARGFTLDRLYRWIDGLPLPILAPLDLLRAKLRAAADPARRRSKRLLDLADAQGLIEDHPELLAGLNSSERTALEQLRP